jgi:hypothetical protein
MKIYELKPNEKGQYEWQIISETHNQMLRVVLDDGAEMSLGGQNGLHISAYNGYMHVIPSANAVRIEIERDANRWVKS